MRRRALLAASGASGGEITFYIQSPLEFNLERKALSGMTWQDWINSDYNLMYESITDNGFYNQFFEIIENTVLHYEDGFMVADQQGTLVSPTDVIENKYVYLYA